MADETPPPLPPPQPTPVVIVSHTEPLAIWSLVLSILSWFGCLFLSAIPAIVLGHVARSRIKKSNGARTGMNMAIAALIIAYLEIPFGILGGMMVVEMLKSDRDRQHQRAIEQTESPSPSSTP